MSTIACPTPARCHVKTHLAGTAAARQCARGRGAPALSAPSPPPPASHRGEHQPDPDGVAMHESDIAFPGIGSNPSWFHTGDDACEESLAAIAAVAGRPDAMVTIYRAVPPGVDAIGEGDWVTPSRAYAQQHAMVNDDPANDWPVLEMKVPAAQLRTPGDSVDEWGWFAGGARQ